MGNDDQLKNWLQRNQPQPPPLNENEASEQLEKLLSRIEPRRIPNSKRSYWFTFVTAACAAGLLIYTFDFGAQNLDKDPSLQIVESSIDDDEDLSTELPTLEIGEDYLILAGS